MTTQPPLPDDSSGSIRIDFKPGSEIKVHLTKKSESSESKDGRVLDFLSNPFILWVLGTVVVGLAGFFWTMSSGCVQDRRTDAKQLHRLQSEILVRVGDARFSVAKVKVGHSSAEAQKAVFRTRVGKESVTNKLAWRELPEKFQATFPELSQRTLWAMLKEVQQLADPDKKKKAGEAEKALAEMVEKLDSADSMDADNLDASLAKVEQLIKPDD